MVTNQESPSHNCPLCSTGTSHYHDGHQPNRSYNWCSNCELVHVPRSFHLCPKEEKLIYDQHENNPNDEGYRTFLNKRASRLISSLPKDAYGLDFGSGPGPTLSLIFKEAGLHCENYDKFYAQHEELLARQYDFISCTEVLEHLDSPAETLGLLFKLLKPGASLGVMTKLRTGRINFATWHYKNDPTHIAFYNEETMQYIAKQYDAKLEIHLPDVIIFTKK